MPLLKYRCKACDLVFDALVSHARMDSVQCEACGGEVARAYEGACLFGMTGSSVERGNACPGECGHGRACGGHQHGGGCQCGHH